MPSKRERLEKTFYGEATDRVPVALWRHWPGDDQRAADLARATVEFQQQYDWDFVAVCPANTVFVTDYGLQSAWTGDTSGQRQITKQPIKKSLQWTELRSLDPARGELGKYYEAISLIEAALDDVPVVVTITSPLTQAALLGEDRLMLRNIRTRPDRLRSGLNVLTESVLNFITALRRTNVAGVFYVMQHADYRLMSAAEYRDFGEPYDRKILEAIPAKWWLNIADFGNAAPMFEVAAGYPVQVIHWDGGSPDLDEGNTLFKGALSTGLSESQHLHFGTPSIVQAAARDVIKQVDGRRLLLSASDAIPVGTPLSNIRAVRESVEGIF